MRVRKSGDRGKTNLGWLNSRHSFSFGAYYEPENTNFGNLLVINEDHVAPGMGFGMHRHADMEIISYVVEGALEHKDSLGTGSVIRPGDIQKMSAGSGIMHSEFNSSKLDPVHFLQIWIRPNRTGIDPTYQQVHVSEEERTGRLREIAGPDGGDNVVTIEQDARIFASFLNAGDSVEHTVQGSAVWVQVISGEIKINGVSISAGDAISGEDIPKLLIDCLADAHLIVFDLGQVKLKRALV